MSATENKVVVFADILGFASLTESHPLDVDRLRARDRFSYYINTYLGAPENPLVDTFSRFHNSLKSATSIANIEHPLTAIAFSDSAFVATAHLHEAVNIAVRLLRSVIVTRVPVRVGIAYGSFAALRFKSDITADGGDHSAQFLGTAVVRATVAEKCGIKGLRILLHPSVIPLLDDPGHNPPGLKNPIHALKCAESELPNMTGVQQEIDYWEFPITEEASAWRALQDMWGKAPPSEHNHYEATAKAIDRMRVNRGHAPLEKLRRRTLPRQAA